MEDLNIRIKTISAVHELPDTSAKSAIPVELKNKFFKTKETVSELPIAGIEKQFSHLVKGMQSIFNDLSIESDNFDIEEIKFTCTIDNNGSVSILGMVEGGIGMQKGIEITLKKKSKNE